MNERRRRVATMVVLYTLLCAISIVVTLELFFLFPRVQAILSPPTPTVTARGERLYNENCLVCHLGGEGEQMIDYPPRHNANGHTWHHPDCELKQVILNGGDEMTAMMRQMMNVPDSVARMPAWKDKLSNDDIDAILVFIKTWWTEDELLMQARTTQKACNGS